MKQLLSYLRAGEIKRSIGVDYFIFALALMGSSLETVATIWRGTYNPPVDFFRGFIGVMAIVLWVLTARNAWGKRNASKFSALMLMLFVVQLCVRNYVYDFATDAAILLYVTIGCGGIFFTSPRLLLSFLVVSGVAVVTTVSIVDYPSVDSHRLYVILAYVLPTSWAVFSINYRIGTRLAVTNERFRILAEYSSDLIAMHDLGGHVRYVSPSVVHLLGYTEAEILGKSAFDVIYEEDRPQAMETYSTHILVGREAVQLEYRLVRKDGSLLWVEAVGTPVKDETGKITHIITTSRDISLRKASERERDQYNEDLVRINRELDQFAYVVSHDLKAPLRGISTLSEFIEEDMGSQPIPAEVRQHLTLLRDRVGRLERMINDILTFSRAGRAATEPEVVSVKGLVEEVVELLALPASFQVVYEGEFPALHVSRVLLEQVFSNLINNAYTHHDKGSGTIRVTSRALGSEAHEFSVCDDGPGIDPKHHERIFELFQQLQNRESGQGSGIGLAVVRKIIEREGGEIRVESALGGGTCFVFRWPHTGGK